MNILDTTCNECKYTEDAAKNGHLGCLKRLYKEEKKWRDGDKLTCSAAARGGNLECLKYAHENGYEWDKNTCAAAAANGHLECLIYARENNCPWDKYTCTYAAKGGHIACLRYAHENECPWDKKTCAAAAVGGHLECLKYAHENGCPWDEYTCQCAAMNGHLDCLRYAHQNNCPCDCAKIKKYDESLDTQPTNPDAEDAKICCVCKTNSHKVQYKPCNHSEFCIRCTNTMIDNCAKEEERRVLKCHLCRAIVESTTLIDI